ncbi:MAG: glycosyltransferase family 4 protein [Terriglobales bacterium]
MRRVLLIAFAYPPVQIIGSVRPAALAKYLPQSGWEAVVLTPERPGSRRQSDLVIETGYRDVLTDWKARLGLGGEKGIHEQFGLRTATQPGAPLLHTRALDFAKYLLTYPDTHKGWIPFALAAIQTVRSQNLDIAAIVTTSPPITSHLVGRRAKTILGCPWIADFRDLWTQNMGERTPQFFQVGLEKRTLKHADALVTVSEPWAQRLQRRYSGKKIYSIPNGFDPDDYGSPAPPLTDEFSVTYTGQLYEGQRDPTMLFQVVRELIGAGRIAARDLRIRFYGDIEPWLPRLVAKYGLEPIVELKGPRPRHEVMERQRESQILLLLPWSDPRETGHHSAKLFEYLAAGRPVLAVGGSRGVLTQSLEETGAGVHGLSSDAVREFLLTSYAEFKQSGRVSYSGNPRAIEHYSHPQMARRFAQVLDSVASGPVSKTSHTEVTLQANLPKHTV